MTIKINIVPYKIIFLKKQGASPRFHRWERYHNIFWYSSSKAKVEKLQTRGVDEQVLWITQITRAVPKAERIEHSNEKRRVQWSLHGLEPRGHVSLRRPVSKQRHWPGRRSMVDVPLFRRQVPIIFIRDLETSPRVQPRAGRALFIHTWSPTVSGGILLGFPRSSSTCPCPIRRRESPSSSPCPWPTSRPAEWKSRRCYWKS